MKKRMCSVCDQEMQSSNYCRTCHRFVRNSYIRDINYYLNETHPEDEADCSYHNGQAAQQQRMSTGQAQIPAQPQAGWQRQASSGRMAAPAYQTSPRMQPARTTASAARTMEKQGSNKWILVLAAFFVIVFLGASQFFRVVADQINNIDYGLGDDVDLGGYEQDFAPTEWDEDGRAYLTDEEVKAVGERCTANTHFSVTIDEFEPEVIQIIESHGYQMLDRDSYSYNVKDDAGEGEEYTNYYTWISYDIDQEPSEEAEYLYMGVYFDHDTATDELHSIEIVLDDVEQVTAIFGEIMELMVMKGMISSAADYERILADMNRQSFEDESFYTTTDGRVAIWCEEYADPYSYSIYLYPSE